MLRAQALAEIFTAFIKRHPGVAEHVGNLANVRVLQERLEDADALYQRALKMNPQSRVSVRASSGFAKRLTCLRQDILSNYGYLKLRQGDFNAASRLAERALRQDPAFEPAQRVLRQAQSALVITAHA